MPRVHSASTHPPVRALLAKTANGGDCSTAGPPTAAAPTGAGPAFARLPMGPRAEPEMMAPSTAAHLLGWTVSVGSGTLFSPIIYRLLRTANSRNPRHFEIIEGRRVYQAFHVP